MLNSEKKFIEFTPPIIPVIFFIAIDFLAVMAIENFILDEKYDLHLFYTAFTCASISVIWFTIPTLRFFRNQNQQLKVGFNL